MDVDAIILAAGFSRRFGGDKRRASFDDQHTLLTKTLELACNHCHQVWVALKTEDETNLLGDFVQHSQVRIVRVKNAEQGMGVSLAAAAQQALKEKIGGALILLGDMPFVKENTMQTIIAAAKADNIVVPYFKKDNELTPGHPVFFARPWLEKLTALDGDRGGRKIWQANMDEVDKVIVTDSGILKDVDTPKQLPNSSH